MKTSTLQHVHATSALTWAVGEVDLIVPVYKNRALVEKCLNSIQSNIAEISSHKPRLIVINDSPEDSDTTTFLKQAKASGLIDVLIENKINIGFVKSVNKALSKSKERLASAILINSDTETFPGTLAELIAVADIDDQFAFVCPRSSNASICTFPRPPHAKSGSSITPQSTHAVWKELKDLLPRYSHAPTAIGFYLLIKSVVIRNFDGFDERFGAGYEEENDLVSRAGKVGFRAIVANHAFAYHAGSASFSLTDIALDGHRSANLEKLNELHPEFLPNVRAFESSPEFRAEALLKGMLRDANGAVDIAFLLFSMGHHHNGTNEFIVNVLKRFVGVAGRRYNITFLCDPATAKFHGLDEFPNVRVTSTFDHIYAVAFSFGQPYDLHTINVMESIAPIVVYSMLDVISLDCAPLRHSQDVTELWEYVAETSNGVVFISDFSKNTFERRFPHQTAQLFTRLLSTQTSCYASRYDNIRRGERHVFVAGNHFDHKDSSRTGKRLANSFPSLSFLIFGAAGVYPFNARVFQSGTVSEGEMVQAICDSSAIVLPSFYEGFGFTLMHALAAGKPIVARDIPATREILSRFEGLEGVYLYSDDDELERLLAEALSVKRSSFSREHGDDWAKWTEQLAHFIGDLLADRQNIQPTVVKRIKRGDSLRTKELIALHRQGPGVSLNPVVVEKSVTIAWRDLADLPTGEFVDCAYQLVLGRDADPEGRLYHIALLNGGLARAELIAAFLASDEFSTSNRNVKINGLPKIVDNGPAESRKSGWRGWFRRS